MFPQAGFLLHDQVVPRLKAVIPRTVLCVGSEDHEELVPDSCALAARIMHNAEAKHKRISPSNAAYYAIQHCKSGRRAVGHSSVDVHGSSTQLNGRSRLESMEEVVACNEEAGGGIYLLHDVLSNDADPRHQTKAGPRDHQLHGPGNPQRNPAESWLDAPAPSPNPL